MRITWLQPWFRRRTVRRTPTLAAAICRWALAHQPRGRSGCNFVKSNSPRKELSGIPIHRIPISLRHHLDVSLVTQHLLHALDCDEWHVVCRHDHQVVVRLSQGGVAKFHVAFECTPAVEKAVCHGSRTWALVLAPTSGENNLPPGKVVELKAGLAGLQA